jgi:hypothetical protein
MLACILQENLRQCDPLTDDTTSMKLIIYILVFQSEDVTAALKNQKNSRQLSMMGF